MNTSTFGIAHHQPGVFALLEHTPGSAGEPLHWDFMLALPGRDQLATWRLSGNPIADEGPLAALPLADHRMIYLDYEGPLSGGRGSVRRLDRGPARVWTATNYWLRIELRGEVLRITAELADGRWRTVIGP